MKSRRASRRSSFEVRRLMDASDAASSQRRRVGRNTIAGSKLYEPSAANKFAGGISGMRSFIIGARASMPAVHRHLADGLPPLTFVDTNAFANPIHLVA